MPDTDAAWPEAFTDEDYFLSKTNPTATADQRDLEALALELLQSPAVRAAKEGATTRFKYLAGHDIPDEALVNFDDQMEEWTFHYLLLALNSDPNYPRVLGHFYGPPHEWMGMKVPGTRGLGTAENVDNHYSVMPIDGRSRFEIHGKGQEPKIGHAPIYVPFNLSMSINVAGLDSRDMEYEDDGTFVVTVGPEPADGRPNHLQTSLDSRFIFIRDSRMNWDEVPNAYRFRRVDPPTAPPKSVEELVPMAVRFIVDDVPANFFFKRMVEYVGANSISEPELSSNVGGMDLQKLIRGHVVLDDDEAYVLTLGAADSDYWVLILYDWWLMSVDFWSRTTTFNNTQSVANPDGSHTYVFSIQDPGVHNWVDTLGLHDIRFLNRWQILPKTDEGYGGEPWARGELVKLADLEATLPEGTVWVTPAEREKQLAERLASFNRRHIV